MAGSSNQLDKEYLAQARDDFGILKSRSWLVQILRNLDHMVGPDAEEMAEKYRSLFYLGLTALDNISLRLQRVRNLGHIVAPRRGRETMGLWIAGMNV